LKHYAEVLRGYARLQASLRSFVLRRLVAEQIDRKPSVRKRLVAAYLLGGNVEVKKGSDKGGDFRNVPACRSSFQLGCGVAYSIYGETPPANSIFGRTPAAGREVLCTNPASLRGGPGKLDPIQPAEPFAPGTTIGVLTSNIGYVLPKVSTTWVEADDSYRARCVSENGANVLKTTPLNGAPTLNALPDATWGLHLTDASLPLGNLADLARRQITAYSRAR